MITLELTEAEARMAVISWNVVPELACVFNEKGELAMVTKMPEFESLGRKLAEATGVEMKEVEDDDPAT